MMMMMMISVKSQGIGAPLKQARSADSCSLTEVSLSTPRAQGGEMAVWNRILNSTMPFTGAHKEHSGLFAVGSNLKQVIGSEEKSCEVDRQPSKIPPLLSKVLMRGTADHVTGGQLIQEKLSLFIAQAECK